MSEEQPGIAIVFGASRGLGLLIARQLLERGYRTVITSRDEDNLRRAVEQLSSSGQVSHEVCDVTDRARVGEVIASVERDLGPIEVCITVAGIIQVAPAEAVTLDHFDQAIATMLMGPVNVAWQVLPAMRQRGEGHIGTITSVGGIVSPPHLLPYATAKFGAVGFSDGLAAAVAGTGVSATTVVPGLMRTGSHLRAQFAGNVGKEYAWFAPAASLPLVSMDADRAARKIVDGVLEGKVWLSLSPMTWLATRVRGLVPGTTTRVMGIANRMLPGGRSSRTVEGHEARTSTTFRTRRAVDTLSVLGNRAAKRNLERPQR